MWTTVYACIECNCTVNLLGCLIKLLCEFGSILLISDIASVSSKEFGDSQPMPVWNNWEKLHLNAELTLRSYWLNI